MSDLTQWTYKRSHSITSGTELTDYQVKIRVYRTEGTSTGDTVYLGSKCLADYGDIRFVASDDTTELSYWMETNAGTYADFWVKVPSIINDSSIYIYYGNSSATTTSNGDATFEFFDDFNDGIYTDKWQDGGISSYGTTIIESDGTIKLTGSTYSYWACLKLKEPLSTNNYALRYKVKLSTYGASYTGLKTNTNSISLSSILVGPNAYWNRTSYGPKRALIKSSSSTSSDLDLNTSTPIDINWHILELYRNSTTLYATYDDASTLSNTDTSYTSFTDISILGTSRSPYDLGTSEYDWILARKYVDIEPIHNEWSDEINNLYLLYINITPISGNDPLSVTYNITTKYQLNNFTLSYGDGQEYTGDDITSFATTHIYDTPGTYTVFAEGYTEFASHVFYQIPDAINVNSSSVNASFTIEQTANHITFTDTSSGNVNEWYWDFGDNTFSHKQNPSHLYYSIGTYTITLHASNQYQYDTYTTTVTVTQILTPPEVYFTPNNLNVISPTLPYTVNFTNLSTPAFGCTYNWLIDGTTYTTENPSHSFATYGMYDVGLTVTNALGSATKTYNDAIRITRKGKTFYEVINYADTPATFHVEVFNEVATSADTIIQAHIFDESINFVQDEVPDEPGLDEWGMRHFYSSINEWGHRIISAVTDWGNRILYNGSTLDNSPVTLFKAQEFREDVVFIDEWQFGTI